MSDAKLTRDQFSPLSLLEQVEPRYSAGYSAAPGSEAREDARLAALDLCDILDTPKEEAFDRIARLAKKMFRVEYVFITMVDAHRSWCKSAEGIDIAEGPRSLSFCQYTIQRPDPLVIPDATLDPKYAQSPYVTGDFGLRFYAGIPLTTRDGHNVGTLCLVDTKPRDFPAEQVEILTDLARIAMDELELRMLATTDSLTGAVSRRAFKEGGTRETALALRHHHDLSCIAIDLDLFKAINDTYGHAAGDTVLIETVRACREQIRQTDLIGRLGGEEFAIFLPHTNIGRAQDVAEKLRAAIDGLAFTFAERLTRVTASFGIASLDQATRDIDTLLAHADAALYAAKAGGRNRCSTWQNPEAAKPTLRRRMLKGGKILFNGRTSVMDCTVRSLSDDGAGLDVSTSLGLPKLFDLSISSDGIEKPCRIVAQSEKHIEVEFCKAA